MSLPAFVQVFLATLLAITAVAKSTNLPAFRQTLIELGIDSRVARVGAFLLPAAELLTAALLLWEPWRLWGEAGVLLLVAAFSWATYRSLSRGRSVDCNCFGALLPEVFGWKTIARIALMALLDGYLFYHLNPTGLERARPEEWVGAVSLSAGLVTLYALISVRFGSEAVPTRTPKEQ